jgi:hypothetical protein
MSYDYLFCSSRFHASLYVAFGIGTIFTRNCQLYAGYKKFNMSRPCNERTETNTASFRHKLRDIFFDGQSHERPP